MKAKTQLDKLRRDRGDGDPVKLGKSDPVKGGMELRLTAPDDDSDDMSDQGTPLQSLCVCLYVLLCRSTRGTRTLIIDHQLSCVYTCTTPILATNN